jgi:hypothetical protein
VGRREETRKLRRESILSAVTDAIASHGVRGMRVDPGRSGRGRVAAAPLLPLTEVCESWTRDVSRTIRAVPHAAR